MNVFHPRTFSTDWEVMVLDRLLRAVDTQKCDAFAGALRSELDLPIHIDWNTIEFGLGINHSMREFWENIQRATSRASELVQSFDLDLLPAAAHPAGQMFNASHIHVGTIVDEVSGIYLENQMMRYVPAFAALAANAPYANGRRGAFKSYRVRHQAHGCTRPGAVRDPHFSQTTWGGDASPKVFGAPTMEVRIIDAASSRRLLAEMGTFIAAYLHYQGERVSTERPSHETYRDHLTNRWLAARDGLQATFLWEGEQRPVVAILDEMLDDCRGALEQLGARRSDLCLIEQMLKKRVCQADFALTLSARYADPHELTSALAKLIRHWDVFDEYLDRAEPLEPLPAIDRDGIVNTHLKHVGEGTHFYRIRDVMYYPQPYADEIIKEMLRRNLVRKEITETRGVVLHRTAENDAAER